MSFPRAVFPALVALAAAADDVQHPMSANAANETLQIVQYPLVIQATAGNVSTGVPHNRGSQVASDAPQIVSEKTALKVYGGSVHSTDGNNAPAYWRLALNEMHEKHAGGQSSAAKDGESTNAILNGSVHHTAEGMVRYMEYFADTVAMEVELGKLAAKSNASILRTNPVVFGKAIRTYLVESLLPPDAVIATCHNPEDCTVSADLSKCDSRFLDPANFVNVNISASRKVPALRGSIPASRPICHSPPTTTDMVYTLVEFEDYSLDWLMWACHRHNLKSMLCHVTDVVVVDGGALRAAAGGFLH